MTGNIEVRGKTVFFLFIILVTGVALGIALRLGTQHERNKSHACFASDFQSTQEFTSNDAFSRLEPITASNAAEIIQANEKEQLKSLRELINEITFSPFESTVSGSDHAVLLLAAKSHDTVGRLSLGKREYVNSIEFNPSRTCIAVGSSLGKVRFLSTETGQEQQAIKTGNWVTTIAFSPDGKMLAYGTQGDNDSIGEVTIGIWDLEANKEFHILKGHTWSISGLVFSSNGQILASSGAIS
jgi:WD40 repeat protein